MKKKKNPRNLTFKLLFFEVGRRYFFDKVYYLSGSGVLVQPYVLFRALTTNNITNIIILTAELFISIIILDLFPSYKT